MLWHTQDALKTHKNTAPSATVLALYVSVNLKMLHSDSLGDVTILCNAAFV